MPNLKRFVVYQMRPYQTWNNILAEAKEEAIEQCQNVADNFRDDLTSWVIEEEDQIGS